MKSKKICVVLLAVCLPLVLTARPAAAGTIEIQFTGLDVEYDNTTAKLLDSGDSDPEDLTTMTFKFDDSVVGIFTDDDDSLSADLEVSGIPTIDWPDDPAVSATAGSVHLFATHLGHTYELELDLIDDDDNDITVFFTPISAAVIARATATLATQDLPFGLEIDTNEEISFSYIGNVSSYTADPDGTITGFVASGPGVINAQGTIPEPSTFALAAIGLVGCLFGYGRRRR